MKIALMISLLQAAFVIALGLLILVTALPLGFKLFFGVPLILIGTVFSVWAAICLWGEFR